jgi:hypothetical protein
LQIDINLRVEKKLLYRFQGAVGAGITTAKNHKNQMNKHIPHIKIPHIIALAAITGLLAFAGNNAQAQTADDLDQTEFPTITSQPVDQAVPVGSDAVLSVQAVNADSYQWQSNGVAIEGQTNSTLTIENVGVDSASSYSCNVSQNGGEAVPTRAASLNVVTPCMTGGGPITVFGMPKAGGGSQGSCPGRYVGYINYTKTIAQGWGWIPSTNTTTIFTASDGSGRTDTKIGYTENMVIPVAIKQQSPFPTRHQVPVTGSQSIFRIMCRQPTIPSF